jgi:farnesyl-diphosphate farnesyltransferase
MAETPDQQLRHLLRGVSRSFYLTLRVLPRSVGPQVGLAYLLARTTDTIADTELVPVDQRLRSLQALRQRIVGTGNIPVDFGDLARHQALPAERTLLEKCEASLALLDALSPADRQLLRDVLQTITSGQELDLRRFSGAAATRIVSLESDRELEDYTYRVAGCVGEFWTRICRRHVFPRARLDDSELLEKGVRFGKGLQLVNILRDLPADLRKGRCYLPKEVLAGLGLAPADLLEPANLPRLRPGLQSYLDRAEAYLAAGWLYTNALPWRHARVRLACAWPILIGAKTIARLRLANLLDPQQHVKISRRETRRLILGSLLFYPWPGLWRTLSGLPAAAAMGKAVAQ